MLPNAFTRLQKMMHTYMGRTRLTYPKTVIRVHSHLLTDALRGARCGGMLSSS